MGSLTNAAEVGMLDHILNKDVYGPFTTIYMGLCTADPGETATGASANECANANNYARTAITFGVAASRAITQSGAVTFPTATGAWGTATHYALFTSSTYGGGDCVGYGALNDDKVIVNGNTPEVATTECVVSITAGEVSNYLANILLDYLFRNQTFTSPTTYLGYTTATIDDTDTGSTITEPVAGGYARKLIYDNLSGTPDWDLAASGDPSYVDNSDDIEFSAATAAQGTVTSFFISDTVTTGAGEILYYDNDPTDQAVGNGDVVKVAVGDCDWTLN
jgi:hypothetical protein